MKRLQEQLRAAGFPLVVDGKMGAMTVLALKRFQRRQGLRVDGVAGHKTWAKLGRPNASRKGVARGSTRVKLIPGSRGTRVQGLQRLLRGAGIKVGLTGVYDANTEAAVRRFQTKHRLPANGIAGPATVAAIRERVLEITSKGPKSSAPVGKPPVVWKPSANFDSRRGMRIDSVVLHHTGSENVAGDLATLRQRGTDVSSHYLIGKDGTIYQLVDDKKRAWHAGKAKLRGTPTDMNGRSIGIEITNRGDGRTPFTPAQYRALEKLVPYLVKRYKIPMKNVVGHKDVAVFESGPMRGRLGRKSDPARNFDWNRIRTSIRQVA